MDQNRKVVESKWIYRGKIFSVRIDKVESSGKTHEIEVVEHPGSFAIAALTEDGLIMVRQYRHAVGADLWEIPAGTAEEGEACEDGARRELQEETGYTADSFELIGKLYPTPGFCDEVVHLYVARGLHAGDSNPEEDEKFEVRHVSFADAWQMQASGDIADMKTVVALLWLSAPPS